MPSREITRHREKWRYECLIDEQIAEPHTNWHPDGTKFRCRSCAALRANGYDGVESEYRELRDKRTGELVSRDEIVLDIPKQGGHAVGD